MGTGAGVVAHGRTDARDAPGADGADRGARRGAALNAACTISQRACTCTVRMHGAWPAACTVACAGSETWLRSMAHAAVHYVTIVIHATRYEHLHALSVSWFVCVHVCKAKVWEAVL